MTAGGGRGDYGVAGDASRSTCLATAIVEL